MGHTSNRNHQRENAKGKRTQQRGTKKLVGAVGIEPTTFGLKGRCSTTELRP